MRSAAGMVLLALLAAAPARSQSLSYVGVYPDESRSTCIHTGHPTVVSQAHVFVTNSLPLKEISFSAPIPSCLGGYLGEASPFATTGNSQSGITIDLGSCTKAPAKVLTIFYLLLPYQPFPPDGVTGVSTEVDLNWLVPDQRCDEYFFLGTYPPNYQEWTRDLDEYTTVFDPARCSPTPPTTGRSPWRAALTSVCVARYGRSPRVPARCRCEPPREAP